MGIEANNVNDWYKVAIQEIGNMEPDRRDAWLAAADLDNNGDLNEMDQFYYTILVSEE